VNNHKTLIQKVIDFVKMNRFIRVLFAGYVYRHWISSSEASLRLRKNEDALDESYWISSLRAYAHMIDKGLHRCDFSKGHGTKAYSLAKNALSKIKSRDGLCDPSVKWAIEKIRKYEEFQSEKSSGLSAEYVRTCCQYSDILDAIKTRRSIRNYLNKPVERDVISKIASVLDWSPTSCNRQTGKVYATDNPDIARECVKLHAGAACFTDVYAPAFFVFCADSRLYPPNEISLPYIDVSLGIQNCNLVAHTLGVSFSMLTWSQHTEQEDCRLRELLGIPQHLQIIVSAVAGYPDGGAHVPVRKQPELYLTT